MKVPNNPGSLTLWGYDKRRDLLSDEAIPGEIPQGLSVIGRDKELVPFGLPSLKVHNDTVIRTLLRPSIGFWFRPPGATGVKNKNAKERGT